MNDFNKGIKYAFEYIFDNLKGKVINNTIENCVTQKELENLEKTIPKKCDFCTNPCKKKWCHTNN